MNSLSVQGLGKRYLVRKGTASDPRAPLRRCASRLLGREPPAEPPREVWALRDVSFDVEPGTVLGIIGPNGSGKSTLLRILGRVTRPSEGRVEGQGRVIPLLELGGGFHPDLSARDNILLGGSMVGIPRAEVTEKIDAILRFANLADHADTPVRRFSGGMRLRLAFSTALNLEPEILLADEVLTVGDAAFQEQCLRRVAAAGASGTTVLFVSHDMATVSRICDRVLWFDAGRLDADGDPAKVIARYGKVTGKRAFGRRKLRRATTLVSSEHGDLLDVSVVSASGAVLGAVPVGEEVGVSIAFRSRQPGLRARCAFTLLADGAFVFRSVIPQDVVADPPGVFRGTGFIPPNLLAERTYVVRANVTFFAGKRELPRLAIQEAATFTAFDPTPPTQIDYKERFRGMVRPRLRWTARRERDGGEDLPEA